MSIISEYLKKEGYDFSKPTKVQQYRAAREYGNLDKEIVSLNDTLTDLFTSGEWRDAPTMKGYSDSVSSTLGKVRGYKDYITKYHANDKGAAELLKALSDTESYYTGATDNLNYLTGYYGSHTNAKAFEDQKAKDDAKAAELLKLQDLAKNADFADRSGYIRSADLLKDRSSGASLYMAMNGDAGWYLGGYDPTKDNSLSSRDVSSLVGVKDTMTDEEKALYYYIANTQGYQSGQDYLLLMQDTLNYRKGKEIANSWAGRNLPILTSLVSGVDSASEGLINAANSLINPNKERPTSAMQYAGGLIGQREMEEGVVQGLAAQISQSIGQMTPQILVSLATGNVGGAAKGVASAASKILSLATLGASVYGNAYNEALQRGQDGWRAYGYGLGNAAVEIAAESFADGINLISSGSWGKALATKLTGNKFKAVTEIVAEIADKPRIKYLLDALGEGAEEVFSAALEPALESFFLKETFDPASVEEMLYSGLLGALTSGVMNAPGVPGQVANYKYYSGMNQTLNDADIDAIRAEAMQMGEDSKSYNAAKEFEGVETKDLANRHRRRILEAFNTENREKTNEIVGNAVARNYAESEKANDNVDKAAEKAAEMKGKYNTATDGKAYTKDGAEADFSDFTETVEIDEEGNAVFTAKDGRTLSTADDVVPEIVAEGVAMLANLPSIPKSAYSTYFQYLPKQTNTKAYTEAFETLFKMGQNAEGMKLATSAAFANTNLGELPQGDIYIQGVNTRKSASEAFDDAVIKAVEAASKDGGFSYKEGKYDDSKIKNLRLSKEQKKIAQLAKVFTKFGLNVKFIASTMAEREKGTVGNGAFDPSTGTIILDINAGENESVLGSGLLWTISHELTHALKVTAPTEFATLQEYILGEMFDSVEALDTAITLEKDAHKKHHPNEKPMTKAEAIEEIVARACENILMDTDAFAKLIADGEQKTPGFAEKIVEVLTNIIDEIVNFFKSLSSEFRSDSEEANFFDKHAEKYEGLKERWIAAFEKGMENAKVVYGTENEITPTKEAKMHSDRYSDYDKPITTDDIAILRLIGRRSINEFTSDDIEKAQKWAYKFYKELGVKSPFFRAWFGDWRAYDKKTIKVIPIEKIEIQERQDADLFVKSGIKNSTLYRGNIKNSDTGFNINIGSHVYNDTLTYANREYSRSRDFEHYKSRISVLKNIKEIAEQSFLLDTSIIKDPDNPNRTFMHYFYNVCTIDGKQYLVKLGVDELNTNNGHLRRAYNVNNIEISPIAVSQVYKPADTIGDIGGTTSDIIISQLFDFVKTYDKNFKPKPVNPIVLNKDGTPKVFYHGSKKGGGFTTFKDWQYFTENQAYAERYTERYNPNSLYKVYIKMDMPFDTRQAKTRKVFEEIRQEYGLSELQDTGLPDWTDGYDISEYIDENELEYDAIILDEGGDLVNGEPVSRGLSYVIRDSAQIKSATDNIGTFDSSNKNIRYSDRSRNNDRDILRNVLADSKLKQSYYSQKMSLQKYQDEQIRYDRALDDIDKTEKDIAFYKKSLFDKSNILVDRNAKSVFHMLADNRLTLSAEDVSENAKALEGKYNSTVSADVLRQRLKKLYNGWLSSGDLTQEMASSSIRDFYNDTFDAYNDAYSFDSSKNLTYVEFEADVYGMFWESSIKRTPKGTAATNLAVVKAENDAYIARIKETLKTIEKLEARKEREFQKLQSAEEKMFTYEAEGLRDVIDAEIRRLNEVARKTGVESRRKAIRERVERASRAAEISTISNYVKKTLKLFEGDTKKQYVPEVLKAPIVEFLTFFDFTKAKTNGGVTQQSARLDDAVQALLNIDTEGFDKVIADFEQAVKDNSFGEDTFAFDLNEDVVNELKEKFESIKAEIKRFENLEPTQRNIYNMDAEALADLKDALRTIYTIVKQANTLIASGMSITDAANGTIDHIKGTKADVSRAGTAARKAYFSLVDPIRFFSRLGPEAAEIFRQLRIADSRRAFMIKRVQDFLQTSVGAEKIKAWKKETHKIDEIPVLDSEGNVIPGNGETIEVTTTQLMALYAHWRRDQSRKHLADSDDDGNERKSGGGVFRTKHKSGEDTFSERIRFSQEIFDKMTSVLTDEQKDVVVKLQNYMSNEISELGNMVTMKRFGLNAFTEKNYIPIVTRVGDVINEEGGGGSNLLKIINKSWTKKTNDNASNTIIIDDFFDVFSKHVAEMIDYNAFAIPLLDAVRWLNFKETANGADKSVRASLKNSFGNDGVEFIKTLIEDINGSSAKPSGGIGMQKVVLRNVKIALVGGKLKQIFLQPTSIVRAAEILGYNNLLKAVGILGKTKGAEDNVNKTFELATKWSGVALWKSMGYIDVNMSGRTFAETILYGDSGGIWNTIKDTGKSLKNKEFGEAYENAIDLGLKPMEIGDKYGWAMLWKASEYKVSETRKDLVPKSDEYYKAVAEVFDDAVYKTQVTDSVLSKASVLRAKNDLTKMSASFMSEPIKSLEWVLDSYAKFVEDTKTMGVKAAFVKNKGNMLRAMWGLTASSIITAVVTSAADTFGDDEESWLDYKIFLKKFFGKHFFDGNLWDELDPLRKIPYVNEIVSIFQKYDPSRLDLESFNEIEQAVTALINYFGGKGNYTGIGVVVQTLEALALTTGLPIQNVVKDIKDVWNATVGEAFEDYEIKEKKK